MSRFVFSADSHFQEPNNLFTEGLPPSLRQGALHVARDDKYIMAKAGDRVIFGHGAGIISHVINPSKDNLALYVGRVKIGDWNATRELNEVYGEILFDLKMAQHQLSKQLGKTSEIDLVSKSYTNLLRSWIED